VGLYETFLAGCHEKAEELDDSGGNFSMFKVMSKDGLAAFERQVKSRFEATDAAKEASAHAYRRDPAHPRRRRGDILRAIYSRQRDSSIAASQAWSRLPTRAPINPSLPQEQRDQPARPHLSSHPAGWNRARRDPSLHQPQ
jgi:hypothetical protein